MYCGNCGRKLPDNSSQCPWCNQHTQTSIQKDNNGNVPRYQKFKIPALVVVFLFVISVGGFFIYSRFLGNKDSGTTTTNQLIPIIPLESKCEKSFKTIRKAINDKSWNAFVANVDLDKLLTNDAKEAIDDIEKKSRQITDSREAERDKFGRDFIQAFMPMVIAMEKQAIYEYVTTGTVSDLNMNENIYIKLLKLNPKEIKKEKKEGDYTFLPVVFSNPKDGSDCVLEFGFIEDNNTWKLVRTRQFQDFTQKMGWSGLENDFSSSNANTYNQPSRTDNQYRNNTPRVPQPTQQRPPRGNVTIEQRNALETARAYARDQYMSKKAVYEQLISDAEKFSQADASWAINHLTGIDWNQNALKTAISYQRDLRMSIRSVKEQLLFEGFTQEQADYAIKHLPK